MIYGRTLICVLLAGVIFLGDCFLPFAVVYGVPYVGVILLAHCLKTPRLVRLMVCLVVGLVVAGYWPHLNTVVWPEIWGRSWAITLVLLVAFLCRYFTRRQNILGLKTAELSLLFKANGDILFRLGIDGTVLAYKVDRDIRMWGFADDILGHRMQDVLPAQSGEQFNSALVEVQKTGSQKMIEYSIALSEGVRWYEARLLLFGNDQMINVVRDITAQKRRELALAESCSDLQGQLDQHKSLAEKSHTELQEQIIRQEKKQTELKKNLQDLKDDSQRQIDSIEDEKTSLKKNIEELLREQTSLKRSFVEMEENYQVQATELARGNVEGQSQISQLQESERQLEQLVEQWEAKHQQCRDELSDTNGKLQSQTVRGESLEQDKYLLGEQLEELNQRKDELEATWSRKESQYRATAEELSRANALRQDSEDLLDTLQNQVNKLKTEIDKINHELSELLEWSDLLEEENNHIRQSQNPLEKPAVGSERFKISTESNAPTGLPGNSGKNRTNPMMSPAANSRPHRNLPLLHRPLRICTVRR